MSIKSEQNKNPFIGIGAQKCASTWVYRILEDHPETIVSTPKELNFFSYHYDHGYQWYESFFDIQPKTKTYGEISPSYFHHLQAPIRAAQYNPDFRVIAVLRDPIARAYSNHLHEIRVGHYKGPDFTFEAGKKNNPMYIDQSRYYNHLRHWYNHFPKNRIKILFQEEILADPSGQARDVYSFLDIAQSHKPLFLFRKANESYSERIKGLDSLLKKAGTAGRKLGGEYLINKIKNTPQIIRLRQANRNHLSRNIPAMLPETEKQLMEELKEDVRELAKLIGRNSLPWEKWNTHVNKL